MKQLLTLNLPTKQIEHVMWYAWNQPIMSVYIELLTVKLIFLQKSPENKLSNLSANFGFFSCQLIFIPLLLNFLMICFWMSLKSWINRTLIYYPIISNEITFILLYNKVLYNIESMVRTWCINNSFKCLANDQRHCILLIDRPLNIILHTDVLFTNI